MLHKRYLQEKIQHDLLKKMVFIEEKDGYFFLSGRSEIVETRKRREVLSLNLWKKVRRYGFIFRMCPFLKMAAVCNSLAYYNADESSDIDIFVVAGKNRLFIVRTFLMFFLEIFGVRLSGKKEAGKFCLSFLVSEDATSLEQIQKKPYDIYLAYWTVTLKPFYGGCDDFLFQNSWIKNYFKQRIELDCSRLLRGQSFLRIFFEKIFSGRIGDFLERNLSYWQLKRALQKLNFLRRPHGVIIQSNILKFHENDRRVEFRERWISRLQNF